MKTFQTIMNGFVLISVITIVLLVGLCCSCWGSSSTNIGVSTPDPKILVGNELIIDCRISNTTIMYNKKQYNVDSSMISFKFKNDYYPRDKIITVNETTAQLRVKSATIDDNGMYYCLLNISGVDHNPLVCVSEVKVGYKPQAVKDFKCISVHLRQLICSWTPPYNPIETRYNLVDRIHKSEYLSRACGHSPTENSCMWGTDTSPPYRITAKKFTFQLIGENQFGRYDKLYSVEHYSIIKPNLPRNLSPLIVTEKSITLTWKPPSYIDIEEEVEERIIYEIVYHSEKHNFLIKPVIIDGIRNTTYRLTGLIPYTKYNISIRCKTIDAMSDEYWSDYESVNITTESDVPYLAPEIIPESFETVKNTEGNRSIILYWKPISIEHFNAPQFYYRVDYSPSFRRKSRSNHLHGNLIDINISSNATYYTFTHLDPNIVYSFKIYGVNEKGISKNFSEITIDKSENIPHKPIDIDVFSYGSGRYELQWNKPGQGTFSIISYTVFWCSNLRPRPFPCKGTIDWKHTVNQSIALELPDFKTNYHFAVSANTHDSSSGMSWATCIVPIDGKLEKIREIYTEVLSSTSIKVNWKLDCPAQKRVVESYKISYCKINPTIYTSKNCIGKKNYAQVSNNLADSHVLTNLDPFSKYIITMVAFTENGPNDASEPKYVNTIPDSPEDSPYNLNILNVYHDSIYLSWSPPSKPNGIITYYDVSINDKIHHLNATQCPNECSYNITELRSYKSHEIKVRACVNPSLCSPYTSILQVRTSQWKPHEMNPPRSENINSTFTRISWSPPAIKNGPINYYLLKLESTDNDTQPTIHNITGDQTYYYLSSECGSVTDQVVPFQRFTAKVLAVNKLDDEEYIGNYSASTYVNPCLILDDSSFYFIGLIAGVAFALSIFVFVCYLLARCMKAKFEEVNKFVPTLPSGLEAPNLGIKDIDEQNDIILIRTDSIAEINTDEMFNSPKHRHDSEESKTSMEGILFRNKTRIEDFIWRNVANDNNQKSLRQLNGKIGHGSVSSNSSNGENHISADSGAEADANRTSVSSDSHKNNIVVKLPLTIVDEKNGDSSGSQDSGWNEEMSSSGIQDRKKKTRRRSITDILQVSLPTRMDVKNPLYDSPLNHTVCAYSLLANSEPSLFDLVIKEDENILDMSKYYKPEMAKSLSNIIQNAGPHSMVNCLVCDSNNTSSKSSTRTTSPIHPYSKYGNRVHYKNNYVTSDSKTQSPNKKIVTNSNYVTIDMVNSKYDASSPQPPSKTRLARHKEWSQSSYDAEVSSTSSNGENDQTELINHPVLFSDTSGAFSECEKIQNNSLADLNHESKPFISPIIATFSSQSKEKSENMLNPIITLSEELKPSINSIKTDLKSKDIPNEAFLKNNNGYITHDTVNQKSANNLIKAKPKVVKNSNGYVSLPDIEMRNISVPNNNIVNHITQV